MPRQSHLLRAIERNVYLRCLSIAGKPKKSACYWIGCTSRNQTESLARSNHSYEELFSSYWYHVRRLVHVAKQPSGGCLLARIDVVLAGFTHLGRNKPTWKIWKEISRERNGLERGYTLALQTRVSFFFFCITSTRDQRILSFSFCFFFLLSTNDQQWMGYCNLWNNNGTSLLINVSTSWYLILVQHLIFTCPVCFWGKFFTYK